MRAFIMVLYALLVNLMINIKDLNKSVWSHVRHSNSLNLTTFLISVQIRSKLYKWIIYAFD